MKNYKITFGEGLEKVCFIENNCVSFSEAVLRLEFTGLDMSQITKVETI